MKIAGLLTGNHPFHKAIMEANDAELFYMGKGVSRYIDEFTSLPSGYDVYITESNFYAPIFVEKIFRGKKTFVANIAGSPRIFSGRVPKRILNKIDLMIVEGKFGEARIRRVGYTGKVKIIYPFVEDSKVKLLKKAKYSPNRKVIEVTTIANGNYKTKGVDVLVNALKKMKREVKLNIIGNTNYVPKETWIKVYGHISFDKVVALLEKSTLYIQSSRFDTFSISALEAIIAGTPTIVSSNCGVSEILNKEDVFESENTSDLAKKIHMAGHTLKMRSTRMKKLGDKYLREIASSKKELRFVNHLKITKK